MKSLRVASERGEYAVVVGQDLLGRIDEIIADEGLPRPSTVVSNTTVGPLYGRSLASKLGAGRPLELGDGEEYKRWDQVEKVCVHLLSDGRHRGETLAAVGGGVVTDLTGFAAAVYLRGISWIAVPTTLLAMVDASVGGKTGINLDQGKNLVGAFWAPQLVVADVTTLATLPARELAAGMAEVVKAAWIGDRTILDLLDGPVPSYGGWPGQRWEELVGRAVALKATVVAADEREVGARQALNFGHTAGHAIEAATDYARFLHGEAVAWGMLVAARLARRQGVLSVEGEDRLKNAVARLGELPPVAGIGTERLLAHLATDKKCDHLGVAWVLPTDEGVVLGRRVAATQIADALIEISC